jgi:glycosyltransferase involved in cell wall biosynthesis
MKILHLPTEIAGQVNLSARGLRAIGVDAYNTARPNPYGYPVDIDPRITWLPVLGNTRDPFLFSGWLKEYDLFHYHKSPYLPGGLDIKLLRSRKKPFVVEFWGSDIRLHDLEKKRNPYFVGDNADNQKRKQARLRFWSENTDEVIFSDHSADIFLQPYFKKIHVVGQRVDTGLYTPAYPSLLNRCPKILHAPSVKATKGTEYVKQAIENLKKAGLDFEYIEVFGVSHQEAVRMYSQADIIIDQLMLGSHGVFACEAMALGKPVICYILDELLPTYAAGFPIVNANPDTLAGVLEELICSPEKRHEIGRKSRKYAEQVHDIRVVARKLLQIYREKMSG